MVCDARLLKGLGEALHLLRELRSEVCQLRDQLPELNRLRAIEAAARTWQEWGGHCPTCAFVRHRDGNPQLSVELLWDYCDCGWHAASAALAAKGTT